MKCDLYEIWVLHHPWPVGSALVAFLQMDQVQNLLSHIAMCVCVIACVCVHVCVRVKLRHSICRNLFPLKLCLVLCGPFSCAD